MTPLFDPLNLILLAIALAVFWRLKSVLGKRTGTERPPADVLVFKPRAEKQVNEPPAPPMGARDDETAKPRWHGVAEEGSTVAKGLDAIVSAMPDFAAQPFLAGAKRAYEMILAAYAADDKAALKPLLAKDVADSFFAMIDRRKADGSSLVFQFVGVNSVRIEKASLEGRNASLTLLFNSEMIHAVRDKNGEVIEGQDRSVRTVEDVWTFERDTTSRDPNWKLVATDDDIG
ncbi:MAG: Tim44 domain-containing protein [Phyllobacteriaceae bacterium]|jgi:predicted lipid-binding transport protein (Tim44 family)|nr:Tim44 domain-containing protein [Phyllobacteriaceae bacterium]